MARIVQKYGGTSVGDIERIKRVAERIKAGVARKRAEQGGRWGRGRLAGDKRAAVEAALARNEGLNKIVKLTGAGKSTVRRIKRELEAVAS